MSTGPVSGRMEGLDALRALLLIGGVFVHSSLISQEAPYALVRYLSSVFRMETFILIGGMLSMFSATRRGSGWIKRRVFILLVPFLFGCIVLNPLNILLLQKVPILQGSENASFADLFKGGGWHLHLWFLPVLAALAPLTLAIRSLWRRHSRPASEFASRIISHRWSALLLFGTMWFGCFMFLVIASLVRWSSIIPSPTEFIVWSIIYYAPYYIIGSIMALYRPIFIFICRINVPLAVIGLAVLFHGSLVRIGATSDLWGPMVKAFEILTSIAIINILLVLFTTMSKIGNNIRKIVEAAYTIYIVHYLLVTVGIFLLQSFEVPNAVRYILLVFLVTIVSYSFHTLVVRRSAVAKVLFNGQFSKAPSSSVPPVSSKV